MENSMSGDKYRLPRLADDVARCDGVGSDDPSEGWREGCKNCLRRTAPRPERVNMMEPPPIIAFECEFLIELNNYNESHPSPRCPNGFECECDEFCPPVDLCRGKAEKFVRDSAGNAKCAPVREPCKDNE